MVVARGVSRDVADARADAGRRHQHADLSRVSLKPYGVLGTRLGANRAMLNAAPPPSDGATCFVDPAGLHFIQSSPGMAGGAAGAIYRFLGIQEAPAFPPPVVASVTGVGKAKHHAYVLPDGGGVAHCIHVVGPDLRTADYPSEEAAAAALTVVYTSVLAEFHSSGVGTLRMLPVSGGIFAGRFGPQMPRLTFAALGRALSELPASWWEVEGGEAHRALEMCIFDEADWDTFERAKEEAGG